MDTVTMEDKAVDKLSSWSSCFLVTCPASLRRVFVNESFSGGERDERSANLIKVWAFFLKRG